MSAPTPDTPDVTDEELPGSIPRPERSPADLDAGPWGRIGAGLLGAALVITGLRRRSLGGAVLALVGGWLSYRALGGFSPLRSSEQEADADASTGPTTIERSVTIGKPADELSVLLQDPENLSRIVSHVAEVTAEDEDRHQWVVRGPLDRELTWDMEVVEDEPGERLRWEAVDGEGLSSEWLVSYRPAPDGRGTEVTFEVRLDPPGGELTRKALTRLDVVPEAALSTALDRFKSLAETGEIPTQEGNPSARGRGDIV